MSGPKQFDPLRFSDQKALVEAENLLVYLEDRKPAPLLCRHLTAFIKSCKAVEKTPPRG